MTYALRIIKKNRWYRDVENYPGKEQGDVPADTLLDFTTKQNELSFWLVDDQQTNIQRLIAALAANRDRIDVFDYLLFDKEIFDQIGIQTELTPGQSPDQIANEWHLAVLNLTATQLANLAIYIWYNPTTQTERYLAGQLVSLIGKSTQAGYFNLGQLKPEIQSQINRKLPN